MAIPERHNHRFCEIFLFFLDFGYTVAKLLLIPVGIFYVCARINVTDVCHVTYSQAITIISINFHLHHGT